MYDVGVLDLNGEEARYTDVDKISYINHESYGPGTKAGIGEDPDPGDRVLVLNVNGFAAALIEVK